NTISLQSQRTSDNASATVQTAGRMDRRRDYPRGPKDRHWQTRRSKPRRVMGTTVIGKMLVVTLFAILLISVTYWESEAGKSIFSMSAKELRCPR
ncbi:MAG TPA: hypothetical protein VIS99_15120, partial [Terrimicrobiaceae bacterium]